MLALYPTGYHTQVDCQVNGSSHDALKELIVSHLLEKKILAMYPALATEASSEEPNRIGINDKFRLIGAIFSDELHEKVMTSEETISHADLDAELVGHNSSFWQLVHMRFHEGFSPDSMDGQNFLDEIHHLHPLFHSGDTVINLKHHGTFTAENLKKVWKGITTEYDTVMVNLTRSGNHDSSFTKAAMRVVTYNDNHSNRHDSNLSSWWFS
jgi:hypothetical protein